MQNYSVNLRTEPSKTFRAKMAAQSVDLNLDEKLLHELSVDCDIPETFAIGMIIGPSGSGKTTLAKQMFGEGVFALEFDQDISLIDLFPAEMTYDDCANILTAAGLSSVPCWLKPMKALSNGQRARAEIALNIAKNKGQTLIVDEWTSVVDRATAKAMSLAIQKFVKRNNLKIILLSCHYDIIEWLDPDWIIDCSLQKFVDRTKLSDGERKKKEQLQFELCRTTKSLWGQFSKYHYLSKSEPKGKHECYALTFENKPIGFMAFMNYVPRRPGNQFIFHSNRVVIHPDFCGLGLGLKMVNLAADDMKKRYPGTKIMAKFSSKPMLRARMRDPKWKFISQDDNLKHQAYTSIGRFARGLENSGLRIAVRTYSFLYTG